MYRGTSGGPEEIVLRRRSRSRVRRRVLVAIAVLIAAAVVIVGFGADRVVPVAMVGVAVAFGVALPAALLRTRPMVVSRAGAELRVESGGERSTFLVTEVRDVQVEPVSVRAHAVVLVLEDGRRVRLGDTFDRGQDARDEVRSLRAALRS